MLTQASCTEICVHMVHTYVMCGFEILSIQTCVSVCVCTWCVCVDACSKVPYSGKLSREKTFTKFQGFVAIRKSLLCENHFFHQFTESNFPKPTPTCPWTYTSVHSNPLPLIVSIASWDKSYISGCYGLETIQARPMFVNIIVLLINRMCPYMAVPYLVWYMSYELYDVYHLWQFPVGYLVTWFTIFFWLDAALK